MADEIERSLDSKLPGDVMVSILTCLPVKSLFKFKAVSKPWCCFISSPRFFKLHLHRQSLVAVHNCLVSLRDDSVLQDRKCGLLNLTTRPGYSYSTPVPVDGDVLILEFPPIDRKSGLLNLTYHYSTIIDSCNGLVCLGSFMTGSTEIILWNPATKTHRSLHLPNGYRRLIFRTLGFCYVHATNDFNILVWNFTRLPTLVDTPYLYVYSLTSDSWDRLDFYAPKTDIRFDRPTFMGRCMHWLAHTCPNAMDCSCSCSSASEILAFDVMDGAMSWFHLPLSCGRHCLTEQQTLVIRGCLSIVNFTDTVGNDLHGFEVWIMDEYGVEGSWVKRFFIQEEFTQIKLPLVSWNYGEIVFNCIHEDKRVLIVYDPYTKMKNYVEFSSLDVLTLFNYVESLASVDTS